MEQGHQGHGDHWGALVPYDVETLIERLLPTMLADGTLLTRVESRESDCSNNAREVCALTWPETDLRGLCLCARSSRETSFELESAYPFAAVGVTHHLTIEKIEEWDNGIEAVLHVSLEKAAFAFFDTRYFENKTRYREGWEFDFVLAGLAYNLAVTKPMPIVIDNPKIVSAIRGVSADSHHALKPIVIRGEGAAVLIPASCVDSDDFAFQARVKEVCTFEFDGKPVWRLRSTVLRDAGDDRDIEIYASRAAIDGPPPQAGDDITGAIWLQGYLYP